MTAPLWTEDEAATATSAARSGSGMWQAHGVSIDSRTVKQGDLFIALSGPNFDGHDYTADAFAKGASAAIVSRRPKNVTDDASLLIVDDPQSALENLAVRARNRSHAKRICITGSVGKTGTKDALIGALAGQGSSHGTVGNLNNDIGAPLTLARMPAETQYGVFELGMNRAGELTALSRLIRPQVAIITLIGPAHLEHFSTVADIALAKAEILTSIEPGGIAILNRDDAQFPVLFEVACERGDITPLTFGAHGDAEIRLLDCQADAAGSDVTAQISGRTMTFRIGSPGRHRVLNSLAVLAAIHAIGADLDHAAASLATTKTSHGRGETAKIALGPNQDFLLIDDSYNANPVSMRAAFATLAVTPPPSGGRRIAVLGDMLELGPRAEMLHAGLACGLKQASTDLVYCVGEHMAALFETLPERMRGGHAPTAEALTPELVAAICPGDIVLVKGSRGAHMSVIVDALKSKAAAKSSRANPKR